MILKGVQLGAANAKDQFESVYELRPFVRIARTDKRQQWHMPPRRLMDFLLIFIVSGEGSFSCNGNCFDVAKDDLIWFPPNAIIELRGTSSSMEQIYVHFDLMYDPEHSPQRVIPSQEQTDFKELNYLIHPAIKHKEICSWEGKLQVVNRQAIQSLLTEICLEDLRGNSVFRSIGLMYQLLAEIQIGLNSNSLYAGNNWHPLHVAANTIIASPEVKLNLQELADSCNVSVSHFRKLFKSTFGKSPKEYHQHAKLQKSCEWLLYSTKNVSEIAEDLHYSTVHNFSRAFKLRFGVSPIAYRKKRQVI